MTRAIRIAACSAMALALVGAGYVASAETARDSRTQSLSLEKKVDDVLANQRLILQKLDDVIEELRVVKVRATHS